MDSAAVDGGDNDGEGEGTKTRTEDEDINWDDAVEGIDEGIEGPEGFRDSDDDDEGRGGDGGATRRRSEIANGPSRDCLLYTSPSPRDKRQSRMPSSA